MNESDEDEIILDDFTMLATALKNGTLIKIDEKEQPRR